MRMLEAIGGLLVAVVLSVGTYNALMFLFRRGDAAAEPEIKSETPKEGNSNV